MEQKPTMRAIFGLQWQLTWKTNQASNEVWFAMTVEMTVLSFNRALQMLKIWLLLIFAKLGEKTFAGFERIGQID